MQSIFKFLNHDFFFSLIFLSLVGMNFSAVADTRITGPACPPAGSPNATEMTDTFGVNACIWSAPIVTASNTVSQGSTPTPTGSFCKCQTSCQTYATASRGSANGLCGGDAISLGICTPMSFQSTVNKTYQFSCTGTNCCNTAANSCSSSNSSGKPRDQAACSAQTPPASNQSYTCCKVPASSGTTSSTPATPSLTN